MNYRRFAVVDPKKSNTFDNSAIGFAETLKDIDKKLRISEITYVSKNRQNSPNVEKTSGLLSADIDLMNTTGCPQQQKINIFHDILGLEYITKNQKEAFEQKSKHLIITGCAGSGKSLILIARLIHQSLTNEKQKILLLVFNETKLHDYKLVFQNEKAPIDYADVSEKNFNLNLWQSSVGIVHCSTNLPDTNCQKLLQNLPENVIVYIDDAHASNFDFSSLNCACIAIDFNQSHLLRDQCLNMKTEGFDIFSLKHNYRSTWNIVSNMKSLSEAIELKEKQQQNFLIHDTKLSHHPNHGHLIHGPQTDIYVCTKDLGFLNVSPVNDLRSIFDGPLSGKCFYLGSNKEFQSLFTILNASLGKRFFVHVNPSEQNIYSTEFSSCYILLYFSGMDTRMLRALYNVISRARVYCSIVVFTSTGYDPEELEELLSIFKESKITHVGSKGRNSKVSDEPGRSSSSKTKSDIRFCDDNSDAKENILDVSLD